MIYTEPRFWAEIKTILRTIRASATKNKTRMNLLRTTGIHVLFLFTIRRILLEQRALILGPTFLLFRKLLVGFKKCFFAFSRSFNPPPLNKVTNSVGINIRTIESHVQISWIL